MINQLSGLDSVTADTLKDPIQAAVTTSEKINFKNGDYDYVATPLYDYKIAGVILSKYDYNPDDSDAEKVIRYDLCMAWGQNVSDKVYLSSNISFSQSNRFCNFYYSGSTSFRSDQASNNHLVTMDDEVLRILKTINRGDEVVITGKLINMTAGNANKSDANNLKSWTTSTDRQDTSSGACEVIYVESIQVLKSAHNTEIAANRYSFIGILIMSSVLFLRLLWFLIFIQPIAKSKW